MLCEIVEAMIPSYRFLGAAKEIRDCNSKDARQPVGWATAWLTLPAWLIVVIELVGEWRFEKGHTQLPLDM